MHEIAEILLNRASQLRGTGTMHNRFLVFMTHFW
jgi:hypothetical protein